MLLDNWMKHYAMGKTQEHQVFKTLFITPMGEWSENEAEGDWHKWNNLPNGVLCCDIKHESYFFVGGKRYDNYNEATQAMYDELFVKPAVMLMIGIMETEVET